MILYKPVGCRECRYTGYQSRTAIHELLRGTPEMKKLIQNKAAVKDLKTQAIKDGMRTLKQDGIEKVVYGYSDLSEIKRVCID